jgi:hypothetical protein
MLIPVQGSSREKLELSAEERQTILDRMKKDWEDKNSRST